MGGDASALPLNMYQPEAAMARRRTAEVSATRALARDAGGLPHRRRAQSALPQPPATWGRHGGIRGLPQCTERSDKLPSLCDKPTADPALISARGLDSEPQPNALPSSG